MTEEKRWLIVETRTAIVYEGPSERLTEEEIVLRSREENQWALRSRTVERLEADE